MNKQPSLRTEEEMNEYENSLTLNQWQEWKRLQKIEERFARDADVIRAYGRYWETLTIHELREAQP